MSCIYGKRYHPNCGCHGCKLTALRRGLTSSGAVKAARQRENVREVGRENVRDFRERVEGRSLEDWHRDTDT